MRESCEKMIGEREIEADFLKWLGGYFDHGGLCVAYQRTQIVRGRTYAVLDAQIMFTGTKEACAFIKNHYFRWNAKLKQRHGSDSWCVHFRSIPEVLSLAHELLPYSKFRQDDLKRVIESIKNFK